MMLGLSTCLAGWTAKVVAAGQVRIGFTIAKTAKEVDDA